jgi:outer membrane immunogenic protein
MRLFRCAGLAGVVAVVGLASVASASASASAADMPMKAAPIATYNWTGFYVGGALGARWSNSDLSITAIDEVFSGNFVQHDLPACTLNTPACGTAASFDNAAVRIGPYFGYNWQFGSQWVAGIEGDWAWANRTTTQGGFKFFQAVPGFMPDSTYSIKAGWDASARARLGFLATKTLLVYTTGGAAWLRTDITSNCGATSCFPGAVTPATITNSSTWAGWTIGGGIETMFGPNWMLRAEYRYADYGTKSFVDVRPCSPTPSPTCGTQTSLNVAYNVSLKSQLVTFGVAYKFGQ